MHSLLQKLIAISCLCLSFHWGSGAIYPVTNTNDSGLGSLREAITNANASSGRDTITFAIGSGAQAISPTSNLPNITDDLHLDGTSQGGYSGTPLITIGRYIQFLGTQNAYIEGLRFNGISSGIFASNLAGLVVRACTFNNINTAISVNTGSDVDIQGSTFDGNSTDIRLNNIAAGSLTRGLVINNNTYVGGGDLVELINVPPRQIVSDGSITGTNVFMPANGYAYTGTVLEISGADSSLISNLNLGGNGGTNPFACLRVRDVDSLLIENNQLGNAGVSMDIDVGNRVWLRNNVMNDLSSQAINVFNCRDLHVLNNTFSNTSTAIYLNQILPGRLSRGVEVLGNTFDQGSIGLDLVNLPAGQIISDGTYANTNINIPRSAFTGFRTSAIQLNDVDSSIISSLNLNDTLTGNFATTYGIFATNCDSLAILNCDLRDRRFGVDVRNQSDITISSCTFGSNTSYAIRLSNISSVDLPRGILIDGNSFNGGRSGIYVNGAPPQIVSNGTFAGTNIRVGTNDLSGFTSYAAEFLNVDSLVVSGLNFSGLGRTQTVGGLRVADADSAWIVNNNLGSCGTGLDADRVRRIMIENNNIGDNNSAAINIFDGADVWIRNNALSDNGTAITLNTIRSGIHLTRGIEINGNTYNQGGTCLSLSNTISGQIISDGTQANSNIVLPATSLQGYRQYGILLNNVDSALIANLNINDSSSSFAFSYGIYGSNCDSISVRNCSFVDRNRGVEFVNGSDCYINNNTFASNTNSSIRLSNILGRNIPQGISISGNSFNGGGTALSLTNVPPQVISDGTFPNSNILVGTNDFSGFSTYAIEMSSTDSSVISNLNLSGRGTGLTSGAVFMNNCDSVLIQNCSLDSASLGLTASRLSRAWIRNNTFNDLGSRGIGISTGSDIRILNNGFRNSSTAISLTSITPRQLNRGLLIQNNTFNGGRTGLEISSTNNQVISDGSFPGTNIFLSPNDLTTYTTYPISLFRSDSSVIANLNLSGLGATTTFASILLSNCDSALVDNNTLSESSRGIDVNTCSSLWIQNNTLSNNASVAIDINGGQDYHILNNTLSNSGTAFTLTNIASNVLPRGIRVNGNTFGGGNTGMSLTNLPSGQIISDGTYPNTNFVLPANAMTGFRGTAFTCSGLDSLIIANLNLSDTSNSTNFGYGVRASNCDSVAMTNCSARGRSIGFEGTAGRDFSLVNNSFGDNSNVAAQFFTVSALDLPRGILMTGNILNRGGTGLYLFRTPPQIISNGSLPNTSINLDSLALIDFTTYALRLEEVDSTIISNLNMGGTTITNKGASIFMRNADSSLIQNCVLGDASRAIDMDRSNRVWVRNNQVSNGTGIDASQITDLYILNNAFSNTSTAFQLSNLIRGRLASGISAIGNTFNGGNIGISLSSSPRMRISEGSLPNSAIVLGTNDLTSFTGSAISISNTDSVQISGLNLGNLVSATRSGTGIFASGSNYLNLEGLTIQNRSVGVNLSTSSFDSLSCIRLEDNSTGLSMGSSSNNNRMVDCFIQGNNTGVNRSTSTSFSDSLNAEGNFWGASNGPLPLGGSGDNFFGAVDASPFLNAIPGCIGIDTCSLQLTSQSVNCTGTNTFEINFAFTGAGNAYRLGNGSNILLDSISAGSYTVGPFPRGTAVSLLLSDLRFANCDTTFTLINPQTNTNLSASICEGDSLAFGGGFIRNAGVYRDTLASGLGCDSILILNLSVLPVFRTNQAVQICQGQSFNFGGQSLNTSGIYVDTLVSRNGCDSISTLTLDVLPTLQSSFSQAICQGDSLFFGGRFVRLTGTYTDTLQSAAGCDSVVSLDLLVNPVFVQAQSVSICEGQLPFTFGGRQLTMGGVYTDSLLSAAACDSIITLTLTVNTNDTTFLTASSCNPAQVGMDTVNLTNANGCDSLVITTTRLLASDTTNLAAAICDNQSFNFNGQTLTLAGRYQANLTNQAGCDSVIVLDLTVNPTFSSRDSAFICQGQSLAFGTQLLTASGTYNELFTSATGCDSLVTLDLTVGNQVVENISASICQGDSLFFGGQFLRSPGTFSDTLVASTACDSIVVLSLSVNPSINQSISLSICENQLPVSFGGRSISLAGTYVDSLQSSTACDSIVTLVLAVLPSDTTFLSTGSCDPNQVGIDTSRLTNRLGCDSLIINNIFLLSPDTSRITASICDGQSFTFGGQNLTVSGTYRDSLSNQEGCDSLVILSLVVNPILGSRDSAFICQGQSFLFGGQLLTTSGSYRDTLTSSVGCDSILILDLQVGNQVFQNLSASICQGESFVFGSQVLTLGGTYRDTLLASSGCDSVVVLDLVVNPTVTNRDSAFICQGDSFAFGGQFLTIPGIYADTLMTSTGCDSISILDLRLGNQLLTNISIDICRGG